MGTSLDDAGKEKDSEKSQSISNTPVETSVEAKGFFARSNQHRTFASSDSESENSFYKPIDSFEGRHRYDPQFQWEPKEERRVVRKVKACRRRTVSCC